MQHMPPRAEKHFAMKHMEDAGKSVAAVVDARLKESEENRRAYERFYNNLALFSGGTVALSVTYLLTVLDTLHYALWPLLSKPGICRSREKTIRD
jgi:hypothetical protein